jgi:hypothetical protein
LVKIVFALNSVYSAWGVGCLLAHRQATYVLQIGVYERFDSDLDWAQQPAPEHLVGALRLLARGRAIVDISTSLLGQIELPVAKPQHTCSDVPDSPMRFELGEEW